MTATTKCQFCRYADCDVCTGDRTCSCHDLVNGHGALGPLQPEALPSVKALLRQWDETTNPIFLAAAGQLRAALRHDRQLSTAETSVRR